ncbi:MAG: hypothetical protein HOC20_12305 [Chloroflexi bacterium]|jgi:archaeal flagellin FlaB|nr:hypothetical protein [Chloroflexota bacterium]
MLKRFMNKVNRYQNGITGLETAIILIAFVVVAAVFAYTVLSAGLFATQKSSEAVYSGLESTQSTLEMKGGVIAYATGGTAQSGQATDLILDNGGSALTNAGTYVTRLQFTVANVLGGEPIDLSPSYTVASTVDAPTDLTISSPDNHVTVIDYDDKFNHFEDCTWTIDYLGMNDGDNLLEAGEKALMTVWLVEHDGTDFNLAASGDTGAWFDDDDDTNSQLIDANHQFRLQIKTSEGAVLSIERTLPAYIDKSMDLH